MYSTSFRLILIKVILCVSRSNLSFIWCWNHACTTCKPFTL